MNAICILYELIRIDLIFLGMFLGTSRTSCTLFWIIKIASSVI